MRPLTQEIMKSSPNVRLKVSKTVPQISQSSPSSKSPTVKKNLPGNSMVCL